MGKAEGGIKSEGGEIVVTKVRRSRRYVGNHLHGKMVYLISCEIGDMTEGELELAERMMRAFAMEETVLVETWIRANRMAKEIIERD